MRPTTMTKAIGLALLVAGVGLILWGLQMSDSIGSQLSEALTGSESDPVMTRYIAGGVCLAVGAFPPEDRRWSPGCPGTPASIETPVTEEAIA